MMSGYDFWNLWTKTTASVQPPPWRFAVGDEVYKDSGDYTFAGWVVSRYTKRSGVIRYVVEDYRGLNFIFPESSLKPGCPLNRPPQDQD